MDAKRLIIDADYLLYLAAPQPPRDSLEGDPLEAPEVDIRVIKQFFKEGVQDLVDKLATDFPGGIDFKQKPLLVFSDPIGNFRYDIFPDYKKNRAGKNCTRI